MKTNAGVQPCDKKFIRAKARHQCRSMSIIRAGWPSPIGLREPIRNSRLPGAEIKLLLRLPRFFNGSLQFVLEVQPGDIAAHREQKRKVLCMGGGCSIPKDVPPFRINSE